ncbi:MAG: hypothetical protein WBW41_04360 [Verrucomicrobiia bacterium]
MNAGKANVRMTEWDKDKTCRLGTRYQFWLKLSERPDPDWQHCFREICDRMATQQPFWADLMIPLTEREQSYARVLGDPREFEGVLYPRLREALRRANEMFDEQKEEERRKGLQLAAKRAEDGRIIAELKTKFQVD